MAQSMALIPNRLSKTVIKPYIRPEPKKGLTRMTVGIAAIAEQKYIVTASDRAITVEIVSDDCVFKAEPFHSEWSAILSGGDISDVVPILKSAERLFADKDNTLENAVESLSGAFRKHLSNKAGNRIFGRYGITMQDYLERGSEYFTPEERLAFAQEIQAERLDCCFLASGFDKDGQPHIFKVVEPGINAVEDTFGTDVDYAQLVKIYGQPKASAANARNWYEPVRVMGAIPMDVMGRPKAAAISTSYVERQNLTMRMQMRRFTRLTNGFSKKLENLKAHIALHFAHYNFVRVHQTLRTTPAMAANLTDHLWTLGELLSAL
jgi:IS1 family transposase